MNISLPIHMSVYSCIVITCIGLLVYFSIQGRNTFGRRTRIVLVSLRSLCLIILLIILLNPVRIQPSDETNRVGKDVFLIDSSASMNLENPQSRMRKVQALITPLLSDDAAAERLQLYMFDHDLHSGSPNTNELPLIAEGSSTQMGRSLSKLLDIAKGMAVRNIVIFSDGKIHDQSNLIEALHQSIREGLPISTYTASDRKPLCNLSIQNCTVERHTRPGSHLPVKIKIEAIGSPDKTIQLELKKKSGEICNRTVIPAGNRTIEHVFQLDVGSNSEDYVVQVLPLPEEITATDNSFSFNVQVVDPKIRILYMEGSNHRAAGGLWEYEFLEKAFQETGSMEVDVFTVTMQSRSGGQLYNVKDRNRGYPKTREELFKYDVVICSDINRAIFSDEQLAWTVELVSERGGGFCMIGGITSFGAGGWDKTVWEQMIPVDMQTVSSGYIWSSIKPVFPPEIRNHPILQMDPDPDKSSQILDAHPQFNGTNLVHRAKPGATALAYMNASATRQSDSYVIIGNSTNRSYVIGQSTRSIPESKDTKDMPLICVQSYGKGRSMAFTSDAAGNWGDQYQTQWGEGSNDNRYYKLFWANAVRWLAENSVSRHISVIMGNTESISYKPGDTINVNAKLLNDDDQGNTQTITIQSCLSIAKADKIDMAYDYDRKEYTAKIILPENVSQDEINVLFQAINHTGRVIGDDTLPLRILHLQKEYRDPASDPNLLADIARMTGGKVIENENDLTELLSRKPIQSVQEAQSFRVPLWDHPMLWLLLILLLSAEWIVRKLRVLS